MIVKFVIINQSDLDISDLEPLIQSMMSFGQDRLGFQDPPSLFLKSDSENASNFLGKTGFYDPIQSEITAFVDQRHPKDILRSISHELVHHAQNCRGEFDKNMELGPGYAQEDPHMREMEKEAYLEGNLILRDWEDNHKKQLQESIYYDSDYIKEISHMSTKKWKDQELNTLLMEKWGYKMPINEKKKHSCANHVKESRSGREGRCINHTLLEDGTVTHYTVEFLNEIVENIPVDKLTILEMNEHMHSPARRDYDHDDSKPRKKYIDVTVKEGDREHATGGDSDSVTVKSGDTLSAIAKNRGVTVDDIMNHGRNKGKIESPDKIKVGQEIFIPQPGVGRKHSDVKEQEMPDIDMSDMEMKAPAAMTTSVPDVKVPDMDDIKINMNESEKKFRAIVREALNKRFRR